MKLSKCLSVFFSLLALMLSFIAVVVVTNEIYGRAEYRYQAADFYAPQNVEDDDDKLNIDRVDFKIYKLAGLFGGESDNKILSEISIPRHDARQLAHSLNNMSFISGFWPRESTCVVYDEEHKIGVRYIYQMEIITRLQFASATLGIIVCNLENSTTVGVWYPKYTITSIHWWRAEADPVFHNIISKLEAYE